MTKQLLFILPLLMLSFSGFAQLQKGNKILGGTISYSTSTNTSDNLGVAGGSTYKNDQFTNSPLLGYFVSDRTVVGLKVDINTSSSETTTISGATFNSESNQFGFGPFVRRYFPVKEWVAFYGQATIGYNTGKTSETFTSNTSSSTSESSTKRFSVITTLGLSFFPTNWMSLDLAINPLSYSHLKTKYEEGSPTESNNANNFNFNLSSESFAIGAHFFFNKK